MKDHMNENELRDLNNIIYGLYGGTMNLEVTSSMVPIHNILATTQYVSGRQTIRMTCDFPSTDCLKDIIRIANIAQDSMDEKRKREQSPAAQRAYEEYQLILKLTQ